MLIIEERKEESFCGEVTWLLLKYCTYFMSAPSLHRESDSLIGGYYLSPCYCVQSKALYHRASIKGRADMHYVHVDVSGIHASLLRVWALPLTEV